jgi:hypothetical protein
MSNTENDPLQFAPTLIRIRIPVSQFLSKYFASRVVRQQKPSFQDVQLTEEYELISANGTESRILQFASSETLIQMS